jgi:hypothetical protein
MKKEFTVTITGQSGKNLFEIPQVFSVMHLKTGDDVSGDAPLLLAKARAKTDFTKKVIVKP